MKRLKSMFGISVVLLGLIYFPYVLLIFPAAYLVGFMINYHRKFLKG